MHPAPSIILFSTLSGAGFGLLAWLGIGIPDVTGLAALLLFGLGYGLAVAGLVASSFHLGKRRNAPKAFSQWRSSWLSREAVLAVVALLAMAPVALARLFGAGALLPLGIAAALACLGTVFCTAMIYAQLRTVPRWNSPATPALFLGYALAGGALLSGQGKVAAVLLALLGIGQILAWRHGDGRFAASGVTAGSATGLERLGTVRQLEPAQSGTTYVMREMAFSIGRKHARKLRVIGAGLGFVLPIPLAVWGGWPGLVAAAICHLGGVLAIRWLFFAEARHVVSLYAEGGAGRPQAAAVAR